MASDGSIVIDVTVDTEELARSLEALSGVLSKSVALMGTEASSSLSNAVADSVTGAKDTALRTVSSAGFESIGAMIAQGLANGLRNSAQAAVGAASSLIESVKGTIKTSVLVQSPSKWAFEVGSFIDEGLANGVRDGSNGVRTAASELMDGLKQTVSQSAEELANIEISALDAVIEAERNAIKERQRERQLELRQNAVDLAVDADVKRMAIEHLSTTEREYALQDLEEYRKLLLERQQAYEDMKNAQIKTLKDISYEEQVIAYDDYNLKIKLYSDEYLEKVSKIDDGLYAFLSAKNVEMQAVIERIALEDKAAAWQLQAILAEKEALIEKSRTEKELRDEKLRAEKETELLRRIWEAETMDEQMKRANDYNKWREEEEYKLSEKSRQLKIEALNDEYKAIVDAVKAAQQEIDGIRKEGDLAVAKAAEAIKSGIVDLEGEQEMLTLSTEQQSKYLENSRKMTLDYYANRANMIASETSKEFAFLKSYNDNLTSLLRSYIPVWFDIGASLMQSMYFGLMSWLSQVDMLVWRLRSQLESLIYLSYQFSTYDNGGYGYDYYDYPMYGTGGVVTKPHLAVVGDTPEAIIPLNRLNEIITAASFYALPQITASEPSGKTVYINQTNNINQPVQSPAETARALKNVSKGLARRF